MAGPTAWRSPREPGRAQTSSAQSLPSPAALASLWAHLRASPTNCAPKSVSGAAWREPSLRPPPPPSHGHARTVGTQGVHSIIMLRCHITLPCITVILLRRCIISPAPPTMQLCYAQRLHFVDRETGAGKPSDQPEVAELLNAGVYTPHRPPCQGGRCPALPKPSRWEARSGKAEAKRQWLFCSASSRMGKGSGASWRARCTPAHSWPPVGTLWSASVTIKSTAPRKLGQHKHFLPQDFPADSSFLSRKL